VKYRPLVLTALLISATANAKVTLFQSRTCHTIAADGLRNIDTWRELFREATEVFEAYFKFLFNHPLYPDKADELSQKFASDYSVAICPSFLQVHGIEAHQARPCYIGNPRYKKLVKFEPSASGIPGEFTVAIENTSGRIFISINPQIIGMRDLNFRKQFYEGLLSWKYSNVSTVLEPLPENCEARLSANLQKALDQSREKLIQWIRGLQ
jgi:hypothetical protein